MGVTKETIKEGDGIHFPKAGDELKMHYTGTLVSNGAEFDSSIGKGRPFMFKIGLGMVIKGWDEGVIQMSVGEKMRAEDARRRSPARGRPSAVTVGRPCIVLRGD